jgi:PHD/YefM family antitoxin component YafN of YafNO toxin-antitoxin module
MQSLHPQNITDSNGNNMVMIPVAEYNSIMEELEELEDLRLYDEAIKNDTGERIPMEDAFKMIEAKRNTNS